MKLRDQLHWSDRLPVTSKTTPPKPANAVSSSERPTDSVVLGWSSPKVTICLLVSVWGDPPHLFFPQFCLGYMWSLALSSSLCACVPNFIVYADRRNIPKPKAIHTLLSQALWLRQGMATLRADIADRLGSGEGRDALASRDEYRRAKP